MIINILKFEHVTCLLTTFGKTSNVPFVLLSIGLNFVHISVNSVSKVGVQAIVSSPLLTIIAKEEILKK